MQWFNKTAQGFNPGSVGKGKCLESGTNPLRRCNTDRAHRSNSSPISYEQTLSRTRTRTMCLTSGTRIWGRLEESRYEYREYACRAPLFLLRPLIPNYGGQAGRIARAAYPGLRLWAVLLNHFMVKDSQCECVPNLDRFDPPDPKKPLPITHF